MPRAAVGSSHTTTAIATVTIRNNTFISAWWWDGNKVLRPLFVHHWNARLFYHTKSTQLHPFVTVM